MMLMKIIKQIVQTVSGKEVCDIAVILTIIMETIQRVVKLQQIV